jgi:GNAT superfamily N-acetyltransferase
MDYRLEDLEFREVDQSRWKDMVRLFESRGAPSYCWCMAWRAQGEETKKKGADRKADLARRVRGGVPIGLLAYAAGEPIAWCSIAPRPTYRPLGGPDDPDADPDSVWSIACFFILRPYRRKSVMTRLLDAAVEHARERGAEVVEAYPVDPDSRSYRFMGFVETFDDAGFREVGRAGKRRHVMRLEL